VLEIGEQHALSGQAMHQRGRPAVERDQIAAVAVARRHRAGKAARGQMVHQAEEERQVINVEALEQRQHPAAVGGVDEVVGVFHTFADSLEADQLTNRVLMQKLAQLAMRDLGENGHDVV
jgi:hypothetical protein